MHQGFGLTIQSHEAQYNNVACRDLQISFVLANVMRIREPAWWNFVAPSQLYSDMVAAVHQGTYADLNIITTALNNDILGCAASTARAPAKTLKPLNKI